MMERQFKDVKLTTQFLEDWSNAPGRTQKRVDKIINMIAISGKLPNSLNEHRTDKDSNIWIGYVTVTREHWRILFTWDEDGTIILIRLLNHDQQDALLSKTTSDDRKNFVEEFA